jgi:hypothetical protein
LLLLLLNLTGDNGRCRRTNDRRQSWARCAGHSDGNAQHPYYFFP